MKKEYEDGIIEIIDDFSAFDELSLEALKNKENKNA